MSYCTRNRDMINIGIYGVSSQSGCAFLADLIRKNVNVYGYARPTAHGRAVVDTIEAQGGVQMDRPENEPEKSQLVPLRGSEVGHDLERLACTSDLILFAHPSVYHEETARELAEFLPRFGSRVPLVLSPSRTLAAPYLWQILGDEYPLISFQTCPYACKCYRPGSVWIKRRKHAWIASAEGDVEPRTVRQLAALFPHMVFSRTPAATSLGNIGAVFHPTAYLLNLPAIRAAERTGRAFSFYQEGIAQNREVGQIVEEVDQIRLQIADALGCQVFGLREAPGEREWSSLMRRVEELDVNSRTNLDEHHRRRAALLRPIHDAVVSGQHWLDYTYGVKRIPGESLAAAIGRTPNFMMGSVPQARYAHEDVATGLVPFEALAQRLGIACAPITRVIDLYTQEFGIDVRETGRNLADFDLEYLRSFLRGEVACHALAS
jgi:opine dehydrogenase